MHLFDYVLEKPAYGWVDQKGNFVKPSRAAIWKEFFRRLNIIKNRPGWLSILCWGAVILLLPCIYFFVVHYFNMWYALAGFGYGMIIMGTHGTVWYHRYATHRSYTYSNKFARFITSFLVPKMIPEEIYVISHHVHHAKSDQPGDPYNANGGWLYCFLADVNHQLISSKLSEPDYHRVSKMLEHTGVPRNSYKSYQKWGSVTRPLPAIVRMLGSVVFWYLVFYLLGGHILATALMSGACLWALGVRTFNYDGHGRGTDKRKEGIDYNRSDMSINQYWPGFVAGEWHNNHHLYPKSARAGFLKYQLDLAWCYIFLLYKLGGVKTYYDFKKRFKEHYLSR